MRKLISVSVNGERVEHDVPIRLLLVDFIRDTLGLTGTHVACTFEGVCGACTVHLDGEAIKSCMMLAVQVDGHEVTTIEGLARGASLHPLQRAFNDHHALQCGYCTAGIIMNSVEFLKHNPDPTETEIRHSLIGNLCRCTGYSHIVEAIQDAASAISTRSAPHE